MLAQADTGTRGLSEKPGCIFENLTQAGKLIVSQPAARHRHEIHDLLAVRGWKRSELPANFLASANVAVPA
ncbi:MAG TPA: hypothetical protein VFI76_03190 [Terrimicrobiaceae bacterium]|nr:hypothetical protein [Terrimicrobiaceae bacterium]